MQHNPKTLSDVTVLRWALVALAVTMTVWMAIAWIHLAAVAMRYYSPLPFWDYWETVPLRDDLAALWAQHNEHRMVFPKLIFASDYLFFAGRQILPLTLNIVFYFGIWLLLSTALYSAALPTVVRICASAAAGIVMAWEGAALQLAGTFLLQWTLMLVSATLALFLLAQVTKAKYSWRHLAGVIVCAVIVNYCAANGLLFWPILIIGAWIVRITKVQLAVLVASAIVFVGVYFIGYHFSQAANTGALSRHPLYAICFIAAYLGMPFTLIWPWLGVCIGLVLVAIFIASIIIATRRRTLNTTTAIVLLGMYSLCLVTAGITAIGRMNPGDANFGAATAHRYIFVPLVATACMILSVAWLAGLREVLLSCIVAGLFLFGLKTIYKSPTVQGWLNFAKQGFTNVQMVSVAVQSGVNDPSLLTKVYPDSRTVEDKAAILSADHLSVFAESHADWLGKAARSVVRVVSDNSIPGAITTVQSLRSSLIVTGWTDSPRGFRHPEQLVFLNDQHQVVGFGEKLRGGMPAEFVSLDTPQALAWIGFVNRKFASKSFSAYVLYPNQRALIRIGKVTAFPRIRMASTEETGAIISSISWQVQGNWLKNGQFPVKPDNMPADSNYYESWSGADSNTGSIHSDLFATPAGGCIVLSGANGPSTTDLSEELIDADTRQTIASVPLNSRDTSWHYWRVDVPANVRRVAVIAEDSGRGWGEWLSIGEPRSCK